MMSGMAVLVNKPTFLFSIYGTRVWWLCFTVASLLALFLMTLSVYASGWGGYISEKVIGRSGVSDSNLLIGRSGVSNSELDVAMSGIAIVAGATNVYMDGTGTHATLNGNLQTLNGFPQATVYFEWGYDTSYGHSSASQIMGAVGAFSSVINGFDPSQTIYYRAVVDSDGINYSSPSTFVATGAIVGGFNLINATVVLVYVAMILFTIIAIGRQSTVAAVLFMAVAIYVGEAFVVAIQEAIRNIFGG